ncbi:MAG: hypothetical protein A3G35_10980 [candidate division NC10 bacterium RIFCSPLOWO2_12_FULL_66_18]|nr:MAG: hypothetical protein A3G35_10980 [candidate division NC10 bacterium RIFCSPLOWO2_12_FULL_66_18]
MAQGIEAKSVEVRHRRSPSIARQSCAKSSGVILTRDLMVTRRVTLRMMWVLIVTETMTLRSRAGQTRRHPTGAH